MVSNFVTRYFNVIQFELLLDTPKQIDYKVRHSHFAYKHEYYSIVYIAHTPFA